MKKISIIITAYNTENYIEKAIESVLHQTYTNWELIIINDGSTDNTLKKTLNFYDFRIKTHTFEKNQGRAKALHYGQLISNGALIGWLDSDDFLHPECLERSLNFLEESKADLIYTDCIQIDIHNREIGLDVRSFKPFSRLNALVYLSAFHFRLFKRDLFDNCPKWDLSLKAGVDHDILLRFLDNPEVKFERLQEPLYFYRRREGQISQNNKIEQAINFYIASKRALKRWNLEDKYELQTEGVNKICLIKK